LTDDFFVVLTEFPTRRSLNFSLLSTDFTTALFSTLEFTSFRSPVKLPVLDRKVSKERFGDDGVDGFWEVVKVGFDFATGLPALEPFFFMLILPTFPAVDSGLKDGALDLLLPIVSPMREVLVDFKLFVKLVFFLLRILVPILLLPTTDLLVLAAFIKLTPILRFVVKFDSPLRVVIDGLDLTEKLWLFDTLGVALTVGALELLNPRLGSVLLG